MRSTLIHIFEAFWRAKRLHIDDVFKLVRPEFSETLSRNKLLARTIRFADEVLKSLSAAEVVKPDLSFSAGDAQDCFDLA